MEKDWKKLLRIAYIDAQKSTNISTQNAAILVDDNDNIILSAINVFLGE